MLQHLKKRLAFYNNLPTSTLIIPLKQCLQANINSNKFKTVCYALLKIKSKFYLSSCHWSVSTTQIIVSAPEFKLTFHWQGLPTITEIGHVFVQKQFIFLFKNVLVYLSLWEIE